MIVAIHQPHYLPWLRYFEKMARCDVFVALDDVEFTRNGWQNRNRILTARGPLTLTVPVQHKLGQRICDVRLADGAWARKHEATLAQAYRGLDEDLKALYRTPWETLVELNMAMLDWHMRRLGLTTPVVRSSELGVPGRATERLVHLVKAVGGTSYLTGAYAIGVYLEPRLFEEAGIGLKIFEWTCPEYPQRLPGFHKDLATVDLLLTHGDESRRILASGARVVEAAPA